MKKLTVIIEKSGTGFSCYALEKDGVIGVGYTREELEKSFFEALQLHIEHTIEQGGSDSLEAYEVTWEERFPMTWQELKEFCNSLPEDRLDEDVLAIEENEVKRFYSAELSEDIYIHKEDEEQRGSLEDMKYHDGEDFNIENYTLQPAGIPFLFIEF